MSNKLYIMVSISCTGKTKFCNKYKNDIEIISLDKIRKKYPNEKSIGRAFKQIQEHLNYGNVLFDANNCKSEHRLKLKKLFNNEIIAILIDVNIDNCLNKLENHHKKGKKLNLSKETLLRQYNEYITDINKLKFEVDKIIKIDEFKNF